MFDDPWDEDDDEGDDEEREAILAAHIGLSVYPQKIPDEDAFDAFRYGVKAFFSANQHAHVYPDTAVMIAPGAIIGSISTRKNTATPPWRARASAGPNRPSRST